MVFSVQELIFIQQQALGLQCLPAGLHGHAQVIHGSAVGERPRSRQEREGFPAKLDRGGCLVGEIRPLGCQYQDLPADDLPLTLRHGGACFRGQQSLHLLEDLCQKVKPPCILKYPGPDHQQPRALLDHFLREQPQPALQGRPVLTVDYMVQPGAHLPRRPVQVAGSQGMVQGLIDQPMPFKPVRCPEMEIVSFLGVIPAENVAAAAPGTDGGSGTSPFCCRGRG